MSHQVFISYSQNKKDVSFVRKLARDLEEASFNVWWDISDLAGGDTWVRSIQNALKNSEHCIVVLSPASMQSDWVAKEYTYAIGLGIKIIPLLYQECEEIPMALSDIQYIDFQGDDNYEQGLQQLLQVLEAKIPILPRRSLKRNLLDAARDPMWQMIGVIVAIITCAWGIYTFYVDGNSEDPRPTPTYAATAVVLGPTLTGTSTTNPQPDVPTLAETAAPPTFTKTPTRTAIPPTSTKTPTRTTVPPKPTRTSTRTPRPQTATVTWTPTEIPTNTPTVTPTATDLATATPTPGPAQTSEGSNASKTDTPVTVTVDNPVPVLPASDCPDWLVTPEPGSGVLFIENHYGFNYDGEITFNGGAAVYFPDKKGDEPGRATIRLLPGHYDYKAVVGQGWQTEGSFNIKDSEMLMMSLYYDFDQRKAGGGIDSSWEAPAGCY